MVELSGPVLSVRPEPAARVPDQPPDATQEPVFPVDQRSVLDWPTRIGFASASSETKGGAGDATFTVIVALPVPAGPVHANVKLVVAVSGADSSDPETLRLPLQPPEVVQEFDEVALHVSRTGVLYSIEPGPPGVAVNVTTGIVATVTVVEALADPPAPVHCNP
ncbi:MAG: hypothetical protein AB7P31_00470 [Steroidobacteraceae bacterium]